MMRRGRLYGVVFQFSRLSSGRGLRRRCLLRVNSYREDEPCGHTAERGGK